MIQQPQVRLLKACIDADRSYRSACARGELISNDMRGVEVHPINGFSQKTGYALEQAGLVELVNLHGRSAFAFLGKYQPNDDDSATT